MSFGALSGNPNIAIAKAVTEFGAVAGIGEGGLHPEVAKYRNIVVQWASARFGMGLDLLRAGLAVNIKIGQGAKPGIGGHLPGRKVVDIIAQLRKIPKGSDALSPAPHHDIYSIEDLAQRVKALRDISKKPVLVKVAAVNKIMYVAVGVARSTAEGIIIDGAGAGTGATPLAIRNHLGIPIDYAIPVVHEWLRKNGVRDNFLVIGGGMLYPEGFGEAISGAEREYEPDRLIERIKEGGEDPAKYGWFLQMAKELYPLQTAGFGIGVERFTRYICGLRAVWEARPFPKLAGIAPTP